MSAVRERLTLKAAFLSGETGIRTREPVLPVTRFPGVPLQPLEHLSSCRLSEFCGCKSRAFLRYDQIFLRKNVIEEDRLMRKA